MLGSAQAKWIESSTCMASVLRRIRGLESYRIP